MLINEIGIAIVRREEGGGEDEVRVRLGDRDSGVVDGRGQAARRGGDAVLHVDRGDVQVVAGIEGDGDGAGSIIRARRSDVLHALDAVDLLFERDRDRGLDDLRIRSYVVAGYVTCGGANCGYRETGSVGMETAPARTISNAQTVANTGRRIKKSTTRALPFATQARVPADALLLHLPVRAGKELEIDTVTGAHHAAASSKRLRLYPSGCTGMPSTRNCVPETMTLSPSCNPLITG